MGMCICFTSCANLPGLDEGLELFCFIYVITFFFTNGLCGGVVYSRSVLYMQALLFIVEKGTQSLHFSFNSGFGCSNLRLLNSRRYFLRFQCLIYVLELRKSWFKVSNLGSIQDFAAMIKAFDILSLETLKSSPTV